MKENWVSDVIRNCFINNSDVFGDESTFLSFEEKTDEHTSSEGYNSDSLFGRFVYADKHGRIQKSKQIMFKLSPNTKMSEFVTFSFINEINFYSKVTPIMCTLDASFSTLIPRFYHSEIRFNIEIDQAAIILEDLTERGFRMTDKKSFIDINHLMLMMRKIGKFHAFSYKAKNTIPDLFYPLANNFLHTSFLVWEKRRKTLLSLAYRGYQRLLRDPIYEKYANDITTLLENADNIYVNTLTGDKENPLSVICHGDYFRSNVMFRYENDIPEDLAFIDLAMCQLASPVLDLIGILYIHADKETRSKYWDTLIDEYYTALAETFPENGVPQKDEILSEFIGRSFYAYLVASYFLPALFASEDGSLSSLLQGRKFNELTDDSIIEAFSVYGGDVCTEILSDMLRDMIDRGFICSK